MRKRYAPSRAAVVPQPLPRERRRDLARRLLGREDERHVAPEDALEHGPDQRIVRAAEDDRVAAGLLERRGVLGDRVHRLLAGLDQRDELRAGDRGERDAGVERVDERLVAAGA